MDKIHKSKGKCPMCGKICGNNGLMIMHFRWKHNCGLRIKHFDGKTGKIVI